ncbi:MAG TPA: PAS domain-containing protein [Rhizomicrobium sp.]|nr:PAS domain-containing protein [Rhizomicrobium sp.]
MSDTDIEFDPGLPEPPPLGFVRNYWLTRRGAAAMPRRSDIAPSDMKAYLPNILLADVVRGGEDFRYRVVGSQLQRYFSGNPTGILMSDALMVFSVETAERTIQVYREVVERRAPLRIRGAGSIYAQHAKLFDALLTPLSDDGETVNLVLGTFVFEWDFSAAVNTRGIVEPDEAALAKALVITH